MKYIHKITQHKCFVKCIAFDPKHNRLLLSLAFPQSLCEQNSVLTEMTQFPRKYEWKYEYHFNDIRKLLGCLVEV